MDGMLLVLQVSMTLRHVLTHLPLQMSKISDQARCSPSPPLRPRPPRRPRVHGASQCRSARPFVCR